MRKLILLALISTSLTACLANDSERALVGAATGAALAAATNGDVLTGAIAGGAAGAICDEVTNICQ